MWVKVGYVDFYWQDRCSDLNRNLWALNQLFYPDVDVVKWNSTFVELEFICSDSNHTNADPPPLCSVFNSFPAVSLRQYLDQDVSLSEDTVHKYSDVVLAKLNKIIVDLRRLFLVEDLVDSIKVWTAPAPLPELGQMKRVVLLSAVCRRGPPVLWPCD